MWAKTVLEGTLGGLPMGRLLAWSLVGSMDKEWFEEATTLPRVGLLDGPDCGSKAAQNSART